MLGGGVVCGFCRLLIDGCGLLLADVVRCCRGCLLSRDVVVVVVRCCLLLCIVRCCAWSLSVVGCLLCVVCCLLFDGWCLAIVFVCLCRWLLFVAS